MLKLTHTKDYLLLIDSEAKIKEGDYFLNIVQKEIYHNHIKNYNTNKYYLKLIIGYYLLREGVEELNLPLLPSPFEDNNEKTSDNFNEQLWENYRKSLNRQMSQLEREAFVAGYKAAQYKQGLYSLEDIKKAIEMAREGSYFEGYDGFSSEYEFKKTEQEIIQLLSTRQYPKEFIMEEVETNSPIPQFKTIRNIEGKFVIQGTYKW